ncbi:hypothetical protein QN277_016193 [Acacia crassicarpa]|uniref:Uncharacterized protein n=1 Tax=Acacia crassicarpa TaxID=499986 RepID=A0AAE1MW55_9FABA|nr:hypothetical protein QN277_016193 [Acacia crassicarpa]
MNVEEKLKKYKEQFEKGKKAEERYEKLLQAVKKNSDLGDGNAVTELRNKNRKLEDEKRRAESETESWKRKCEELNKRLLTVEKGAKSSMNGYGEIRANSEDICGARRNTDHGVSTEALDEMELNQVVKRAVDSGNTPVDSSPSQRKTKFVNLASDDEKNAQLETEDVHDDGSIQQKYNTRSRRRGSHNEMQDSSAKSFWCNMPEGQEVAKINKRKRGMRTIYNSSGLKNQASKKGKMDAQHQRQINGNERASPTVQTKIGTIVENQSQERSSNEMVIIDGPSNEMVVDGRGDASTQALGTPEPPEPDMFGRAFDRVFDRVFARAFDRVFDKAFDRSNGESNFIRTTVRETKGIEFNVHTGHKESI